MRYLFVLGATSKRTGLSLGDDAPGGSWGTGLSTIALRSFAAGDESLMEDCESCLLRADMAFALRRLRCKFRPVLELMSNVRYVLKAAASEKAQRRKIAWKADINWS